MRVVLGRTDALGHRDDPGRRPIEVSDAAFDDDTYFSAAFAKPDNSDLVLGGAQFGGLVWGEGEALGLRKGDPELKAKFDEAIAAALADGTVKKLSEKWFKVNVAP